MATPVPTSTLLARRRATILKALRERARTQLYPQPAAGAGNPLQDLANTFTRYASTQSTAFDKGAAGSVATAGANLLERQVERAMAQVLGGAYGRGADSFRNALYGAFPLTADGQVQTTPSRSMVSLYSANGNGNTPNLQDATAAGLAGQMSVEQANLYRQASVAAGDALKVLPTLQPFVPIAESDRVEALRARVGSDIQALVDEFGRLDEPRPDRVKTYLDSLDGPTGHLHQFGESAYLARGMAAPTSVADEAQIAGFALLRSYALSLRTMWNAYYDTRAAQVRSDPFPLFSDRLARASTMLPVLAEGNSNFMAAMDSIGFTENERRSVATRFRTLDTTNPQLPQMTVNDLNEWLDRFASFEGPSALSDSGQYGLEFVTDQANGIFWVIVPILAHIKTGGTQNLNSMPIVAQALVHERVSWALDDLFGQLNALADLALTA